MRRDRLQTRELPIENQTLSNSHLIRNSPTFQRCSNSSNTKMPSFSDATDNHSPPGDQTNESQIVKTKLAARTCDSCNNVLWRVFNFLFKLHKSFKGLLSNDCLKVCWAMIGVLLESITGHSSPSYCPLFTGFLILSSANYTNWKRYCRCCSCLFGPKICLKPGLVVIIDQQW